MTNTHAGSTVALLKTFSRSKVEEITHERVTNQNKEGTALVGQATSCKA